MICAFRLNVCWYNNFMWYFYYLALVGTIISIVGLTRIAYIFHDVIHPKTLSELAASEEHLLRKFQLILVICGFLFALTIFGYIVFYVKHTELIILFGTLMVGGEFVAALMPAGGKFNKIHLIMAYIMAMGMLGLAVLFAINLKGVTQISVIVCFICMLLSAFLTVVDKHRYIFYELIFIFSSHFSILITTFSLMH
jgi:hypothetical protein